MAASQMLSEGQVVINFNCICPKYCSVFQGRHWKVLADSKNEKAKRYLMNLWKYILLISIASLCLGVGIFIVFVTSKHHLLKWLKPKYVSNIINYSLYVCISSSWIAALIGFTLLFSLFFLTDDNINRFVTRFYKIIDFPAVLFSISIISVFIALFVWLPTIGYTNPILYISFIMVCLLMLGMYLKLVISIIDNCYGNIDEIVSETEENISKEIGSTIKTHMV